MKNKILSILFCIFITTFLILNIVIKDKDISTSERRKLNKLPEINMKNIKSGLVFDEFEEYATDNFVLREEFRSIKAFVGFNFLRQKDYNNLYYKNGYIYKIEYPLREDKIINFTKKINRIYNEKLKNNKVYYSIIPDKNYYSKDNYLKLDYDKLIDIVSDNLNKDIKYVDITKKLELSSYYYTDIHWRQDKILNVVNELSSVMDFKVTDKYEQKEYEPFYGSYYGQIGLKVKPDKITYLTNDIIEKSKVKDVENKINKVYNIESLGKIDSYDVYLGGATPLIEITNKKNKKGKDLIVFRDSFGSSITPLLIEGYHKIILIDLRYIDYSLLDNYVKFDKQDVLFLYNTTIINNSDIIKVSVK